MPRSVPALLNDIQDYSGRCLSFTTGKSYLAYANDDRLQAAVERCLSIVGEAVWQAMKQDPFIVTAIPDAPAIIGLRHRLIHEYFDISEAVIWSVLQEHLATLQIQVKALQDAATGAGENGDED